MNFWRNSIQKYYSKLIFFPVYIQFNKIFIQYKKGVPPRANPPPDPPPPTHTNSYLQRRLIVDIYYYFSGKTFKAATKLTPRDAELVAKVKFCQSFIGMGMVVLMMEVIVKVIHFLQFWWVGMVDAVDIFIHVFVTFWDQVAEEQRRFDAKVSWLAASPQVPSSSSSFLKSTKQEMASKMTTAQWLANT